MAQARLSVRKIREVLRLKSEARLSDRQIAAVLGSARSGVGKSYLACAIGHAACRADHSVRCFRLPRLIDELTRHTALQNKSTFLRQLAKADLIIIDDFGLAPTARCDPSRPAGDPR